MSDHKPDPLTALREQRKFVMFQMVMIPVGIVVVIFTVLAVALVWTGKLSLEAAGTFIGGTVLAAFFAAVKLASDVIFANTREDEARIAAAASKASLVRASAGEGDASGPDETVPASDPTIEIVLTESTDPTKR
jgi:hypothetical protein